MLSIRTNVVALLTHQSLLRSQRAMQTAMERLATGLRINRAADDPAGQAIANRMRAQLAGMGQAQRNTNDGISMVQTAEGALGSINQQLQRIRELTVRAANGTNSQRDLDSMQDEIAQRLAEIDRLSAQTRFNGVSVLDRDGPLSIQVGANDGDTIHVDLRRINTETLGLDAFTVNGGVPASAEDVLAAMTSGATVATHASGTTTTWTRLAHGEYTSDPNAPASGNTITGEQLQVRVAQSDADVVVDNGSGQSYRIAVADGVVRADGQPVRVDRDGKLLPASSAARSARPLQTLDDALTQVDRLRSRLGALQNRFSSVIDNLGSSMVNLDAARSRIEDADYAQEVSRLIRAQIQQQVGIAMLAQANRTPYLLLTLLRQSLA